MTLKRPLLAAGFAVLGALSMVTFSAVASPDDLSQSTLSQSTLSQSTLSQSTLSAEQDARPEARPNQRGKKGQKGQSRGAKMMLAVESLDLTPEQRSQLEAMKAGHRPNKQAKGQKRGQGSSVDLFAGDIDRQAAHAQIDSRYQNRLERAHTRLDRTLDVLAILTPAQRAELKAELKPEQRSERPR